METQIDYWQAHALLEWQIELGVDEAICETPVDRYELADKAPKAAPAGSGATPATTRGAAAAPPVAPKEDNAALALTAAKAATSLEALKNALAGFSHCSFKQGAKNLVFADGAENARVMVIGNPPRRDEDVAGKPFVGEAGELLNKMFAAIGLSRQSEEAATGLYVINAIPWRPPENRDPSSDEIAMMKPFLLRHIELKNPDIIVLMGNWACSAVLGRAGLRRMRGQWQEALGKPCLPMLHPEDLRQTPLAKRDAWADLLELKARLNPPQ